MHLSLSIAMKHLEGVAKLAVPENAYLSCVHTYLRSVELDVVDKVRADSIASHVELRQLVDKQRVVNDQVDRFLRGEL